MDNHKCLVAISNWNVGHGTKEESSCVLVIKKVNDYEKLREDIEKICNELKIKFNFNYQEKW